MIISSIDSDIIIAKANIYNLLSSFSTLNQNFTITWRFPNYMQDLHLPRQGFKIHISATIFNAGEIFDIVIPFLLSHRIGFKVVGSIAELLSLNMNYFGYIQVGKFFTIYPNNQQSTASLIKNLYNMTKGFSGPRIPSDIRIHPDSVVHYRYGIIKSDEDSAKIKNSLINIDGDFEEDKRDPSLPIPTWIDDIISPYWPENSSCNKFKTKSKLFADRFVLIKTLRQRARGGVYFALDMSMRHKKQIQKVLLKEARIFSELEVSGIDAIIRLDWQAKVQSELSNFGIAPNVLDIFEFQSHRYLVSEFYEGYSYYEIIKEPKFTLAIKLNILIKIAEFLSKVHELGLFLFDLSPDNVRINDAFEVKFVDFEYVVGNNAPSEPSWEIGTKGFYPPKNLIDRCNLEKKWLYRDIFAFGSMLCAAFSSEWYENINSSSAHNDWNLPDYACDFPEEIWKLIKYTKEIEKIDKNSLKYIMAGLIKFLSQLE